jgi:hypothetical protein
MHQASVESVRLRYFIQLSGLPHKIRSFRQRLSLFSQLVFNARNKIVERWNHSFVVLDPMLQKQVAKRAIAAQEVGMGEIRSV